MRALAAEEAWAEKCLPWWCRQGSLQPRKGGWWWLMSCRRKQARLDGALSNLVEWKVSLSMAGALELDDLWGCFKSKQFYDSERKQSEVLWAGVATCTMWLPNPGKSLWDQTIRTPACREMCPREFIRTLKNKAAVQSHSKNCSKFQQR